jgi:hypothetical protein
MDEKLDRVAFNFFIPAINVPFKIYAGKVAARRLSSAMAASA